MTDRPSSLRRPITAGLLVAASLGITTPTLAGDKPPKAEDILKNIVVLAAGSQKPLPKIGILPSLSSDLADVTIHSVVRRDLDLCGEFRVMKESEAPDGLYLSDTPIDVKAWRKKGANAVVKVSGKKLANGKVELNGVAFFAETGDTPVFKKRIEVDPQRVRLESHRVTDALIGALTGTPGGFSSQMAFVLPTGRLRQAYVIDADGHDPRAVSRDDEVAVTPTFGPGNQVFYAGSRKRGAFQILSPGSAKAVALKRRGSVYGIAFSRDRKKVAVSMGVGPEIGLFVGPDFTHLERHGTNPIALQPTFTPSGKVAYSGSGRWAQRIFVDGKPVSPRGLSASHPTFCRHPDGTRLIYGVGVGRNIDLVVSGPRGGSVVRLTQNQGINSHPACSPDGRLVAFFSTRKSGQGPGLYVMRIDGTRAKRISTLVGHSLQWARR